MDSPRVGCIPEHPLLLARLRDALGGPAHVQAFPDSSSALPSILRGDIRCTVVAVDARGFADSFQIIRIVRHATPSHAVVAWCDRASLSTRQLLDIAQTGVAEMALRDVDDLRHVLARILTSATQRSHARRIEDRLRDDVPAAMQPLFRFALEQADRTTDIDGVSAGFGITRQTLRNRLLQHGMPQPRAFLTWCRLLVAATLLEERGHTLDTVGLQLDFSSGHHLGTVMRRYVGLSLTEMRDTSVVDAVDRAFRHALAQAAANSGRAGRTDARDSLPDHSARD